MSKVIRPKSADKPIREWTYTSQMLQHIRNGKMLVVTNLLNCKSTRSMNWLIIPPIVKSLRIDGYSMLNPMVINAHI